MQIKAKKTFIERAVSPHPFYADEIINVPDEIAQKIISRGQATQHIEAPKPVEKPAATKKAK